LSIKRVVLNIYNTVSGLRFGYHNHQHEFEKAGPDRATFYSQIVEKGGPDVYLEIDVYWVQHAGVDPVALIESQPGRLPVVRFKDKEVTNRNPVMAPIGEGNLNRTQIIPALVASGAEWYAVEQDECFRNPFDCLKSSFDFLLGQQARGLRRQVKYVMCLSATYFALFVAVVLAAVPASRSAQPAPTKDVLRRIDATEADGLCLRAAGATIALTTLGGETAASFPIDKTSLMVNPVVHTKFTSINRKRKYLSASQVWNLTDKSGEGVKISDDTVRTLIVISRIDQTLTLRNGDGTNYRIPGHSFVLLNNPAPTATLDYSGTNWLGTGNTYKEKMWPIVQPTEVIVSPNDSGLNGGFPSVVEDTHCDQPTDLGTH
jgi:hypothetical protein